MAVSTSNNSQKHETDGKLIRWDITSAVTMNIYDPLHATAFFLSLLELGMVPILTTQGIIISDWVHFPVKQSHSYSQEEKIFANNPNPVF
jgi:hypothetical protein